MEQKRIKVRLTKNSPYSEYGYYKKGNIGYIDGYVNDNAVIILENGKFAKAGLRWIEVVNDKDKNVNSELAETEDERIRKELIEFVKSRGGFKQEYIAWLEKHGEQKPNPVLDIDIPFGAKDSELQEASYHIPEGFHAEIEGNRVVIKRGEQKSTDKPEPKFHEGDIIKPKDGGHEPWQIMQVDMFDKKYRFKDGYVVHFSQEDAYELVEQKLADKIEPIFNVGDKIQYSKGCGTIMTIEKIENGEYIFSNNMGHTTIENGNQWYLVEQNSAWNEEDGRIKDNCISFLGFNKEYSPQAECIDECINWLKSLKDRVQPKQEWSDEDENTRKKIIKFLKEQNYFDGKANEFKEPYKKEYDWLKSLRPQTTWKPSESDIIILEQVIDGTVNPINYQATLHIILEQLKKLKG